MNLQSIHIGDHTYLVEFIDKCDELSQFVMIRNFTFINDIVIDKDIYFIQKSVFNKYINEIQSGNNIDNTILSFPIPNTKNSGYSKNYSEFNNAFIDSFLLNDDNFDKGVYNLYSYDEKNNKFEEAYISCYKFRIYHPITKGNINAIIHVDNYLNGIHFHYLCNEYNNFTYNSENEIMYNNQPFSEYIEILIPNLYELFGYKHEKDIIVKNEISNKTHTISKNIYNIYYKENMVFSVSVKNQNFLSHMIFKNPDYENYIYENENTQYVPLSLMLQPYSISNEIIDVDNNNNANYKQVKIYYKNKVLVENNQLSMPLSLKLFPYESYDSNNNIYILDTNYNDDSCTFISEYKLELSSSLGFTNGKVSIISKFIFPDYNSNNISFYDLYKYLYGINIEEYKIDKYIPEINTLDNITDISNEMKTSMSDWLKTKNYDTPKTDIEWLDKFKEMRKESIIQEYEEELGTSVNFIGYIIEIASDVNFKNIIYKSYKTSEIEELNNFSFYINNIFDNWKEKPEVLIGRTRFIDRYTGVELVSNNVIITNEWFKYLLKECDNYKINILNKYNDNMKKIILPNKTKDTIINNIDQIKNACYQIRNDIETFKTTHSYSYSYNDDMYSQYEQCMNLLIHVNNSINILGNNITDIKNTISNTEFNPINFINNISCTVKNNNNSDLKSNNQNNQKIIFKPIFYKINDLQNIQIRANLIQNIAIKLSDYMTKVTTFKILIDDNEFVETGRNSVFVLFSIDPKKLSNSSGTYDIINQDDEYISSGSWEIV